MKTRRILIGIKSGVGLSLILALLWVGIATGLSPLDQSLIGAARSGDLERAKTLLRRCANINAKDQLGCTALTWAAKDDDVNLVGLLIRKGADLNAKDEFGETALKLARNKEIAGLLKAFGAKE